jgi:hypothetical protein
MNPKFIISHLDVQLGPFDEAELKAEWVKGEILPIDYVYDESVSDWILLSEKFAWAGAKAETVTPPPLKEAPKKTRAQIAATPSSPAPIVFANSSDPIVVLEAAPAVKAAENAGAKVNLVGGVGEVDLSPLEPGNVELVLQNSSAGALSLQNPLKIHVRPAEPVAIEWSLAATQTVGQDAEIQVRALDKSGHLCSHYEDHFAIRVNGVDGKEIPVPLKNGQALIKIQHTKAESWRLSFHYKGGRVLKLPEDRALEWQPGPATKLILDGPKEYVAGHPLKVQVKAVDNFGNLAKTFSGTVVLEVKAS